MALLLNQRYEILTRIGGGGMGVVYKAADRKLGGRFVAVKEMRQENLSPGEIVAASAAFKQEAFMLAALHHQNLPGVIDHFDEHKNWYLVMDFIEGKTLEAYLKMQGGTLLPEEVLPIGIQLCTVLEYLHARRPHPIIFRDLKPSNIMRASDGHLYLIDFGIARHFKTGQANDTRAFHTPGYAAPEQQGLLASTTPRSDIYSLGATLHQLLSGNAPSNTPFLFAPLRLQGQGNTSDLARLVLQMVEMDQNRRPANMKVVKQELQRIATSRQPVPSNVSPVQNTKPIAQPSPLHASGATSVPVQPSIINTAPPLTKTRQPLSSQSHESRLQGPQSRVLVQPSRSKPSARFTRPDRSHFLQPRLMGLNWSDMWDIFQDAMSHFLQSLLMVLFTFLLMAVIGIPINFFFGVLAGNLSCIPILLFTGFLTGKETETGKWGFLMGIMSSAILMIIGIAGGIIGTNVLTILGISATVRVFWIIICVFSGLIALLGAWVGAWFATR